MSMLVRRHGLVAFVLLVSVVANNLEVSTRGYRSTLKQLYVADGDAGVDDFVADESGGKPKFLNPSGEGEISIVNFYKDRCEPCEAFKEHFINLADQIHTLINEEEEEELSKGSPTITFHAVHCSKHPQLCRDENVESFPAVRAYRNTNALDLHPTELHPYHVLRRLRFDINQIAEDTARRTDEVSHDLGKQRREVSKRSKAALGWILQNELFKESDAGLPEAMRGLLRLWLSLLNQTLPQLKHFTSELLNRYKYIAKNKLYLAPIFEEFKVEATQTLDCESIYDLFQSVIVGAMEFNSFGFDSSEMLHPAIVAHTNYQFVKTYAHVCNLRERFLEPYEVCVEDPTCPHYDILHVPDDVQAKSTEKDWNTLAIWWAQVVRPQPFPSAGACPNCRNDPKALMRFLRLEYGAFHSNIEDIKPLFMQQPFGLHQASLLFLVLGTFLLMRSGGHFISFSKRRRRYTLSIAIDMNHSKGE
jgi:thiol-disulfide isomerase/thioredoxin